MARRNYAVLQHLLRDRDKFVEWIAISSFYTALQVVDAVFYVRGDWCNDHSSRHDILKHERPYESIWEHYRPLWQASMIARYLQCDGKSYAGFSDYMPGATAESELVNHRLRKVIKSGGVLLRRDLDAEICRESEDT